MAQLCPGKEKRIQDSKDLDPAVFRRLVVRRYRQRVDPTQPLVEDEDVRRELEKNFLEKINLTSDFLPAKFLRDGAFRAEAVCQILVSTGLGTASGTGFLIAPGIIMTNNHVIASTDEARSATAQFGFEEGSTPITVSIQPDLIFVTDVELDFTIVGCAGQGIDQLPTIPLSRNSVLATRNDPVNIIQHPAGRQKEIAIHENKVKRVQDKVIHYETDTEPGSSGSPVFNNDWDLVGLHHAGWRENGGRATNEGIRISSIVDHLLQNFGPQPANDDDLLGKLMNSIRDASPDLGFFDTLGLPQTGDEIQVDDFSGSPAFADIGVWNIEHFNNGISQNRIEDVADVVSRLAMDALGLTEVESGALQRLSVELGLRGLNYQFELLDVRGAQDIAVFYDADTTNVTRRDDITDRHANLLETRTDADKSAFPRFPLFAECEVMQDGDSVKFLMIVVHLKAFGDAQSRERRRLAARILAEIVEDIRENEELPVVLGGDFNEQLNNDVLSALTGSPDLFAMTADDATTDAISFVGRRHKSLIDHIIVSNDVKRGSIQGDDAAIVRLDRNVRDFADKVSDHVPIVFRMIMRDAPIDVDMDASTNGHALEIPEGATEVELVFKD